MYKFNICKIQNDDNDNDNDDNNNTTNNTERAREWYLVVSLEDKFQELPTIGAPIQPELDPITMITRLASNSNFKH